MKIRVCNWFYKTIKSDCPFITEEINLRLLGKEQSLSTGPWPEYDKKILETNFCNMVVMVDNRKKAIIEQCPIFRDEKEMVDYLMSQESTKGIIESIDLKNIYYVKGKVINLLTTKAITRNRKK